MMLSVFCSPSRYTQGRGATAALGREMAALGLEGPALIIAGKTVIGRLADTWKSGLDEAKMRHTVYRFSGECSSAEIGRAKELRGSAQHGRSWAPAAARSSTPPKPSGLAAAHAVHNGLTAAHDTHAYLHGETPTNDPSPTRPGKITRSGTAE